VLRMVSPQGSCNTPDTPHHPPKHSPASARGSTYCSIDSPTAALLSFCHWQRVLLLLWLASPAMKLLTTSRTSRKPRICSLLVRPFS